MAALLDRITSILSDSEIKDFLTGKKSPTINVNAQTDTETLKSLSFYLFLALGGFAVVLSFLLFWAMYIALKWALR